MKVTNKLKARVHKKAAPDNAKQVVDLTLEPYLPVLKEDDEKAV